MVNDGEAKVLQGTIQYTSYLSNPNIRLRMYRRDYDSVNSTNYVAVDLQNYVTDTLSPSSETYSYYITREPHIINNYSINMQSSGMLTGTYRLDFELYDNNSFRRGFRKSTFSICIWKVIIL